MPKQLIPISFRGIDTKTDPKQVIVGDLLELQNGVFTKTRAISKRWGYDALGMTIQDTTTSIQSCAGLTSFLNELLLFDGLTAYAYLPSNDTWISKGHCVSVITDNNQIIRNNGEQLSPDCASLNGVDVYVWEDITGGGIGGGGVRNGIHYSIVDQATETFIVKNAKVGSASNYQRPKVIAYPAANLIALFFTDDAGVIYSAPIYPNRPTQAPVITVYASDSYADTVFDAVCAYNWDASYGSGSQQYIFLCYYAAKNDPPNVAALRLTYMGAALTPISSRDQGEYVQPGPVNMAAAPGPFGSPGANYYTLWMTGVELYTGIDDIRANSFALASDGTIGSIGGATSILYTSGSDVVQSVALAQADPIGNMIAYFEIQGSQTYFQLIKSNTIDVNNTTPGTAGVFIRGLGLASKPFLQNGLIYLNTIFSSPLQATYFTLDQNTNVVAKVSAGLAGVLVASSHGMLPECQAIDTSVFKFANLVKGRIQSQNNTVFSLLGVNATTLDFAHSNQFASTSINDGLYLVGGVMQSYDGANFSETNFHYYPEGITSSITTSGGNLGDGQYQYVVCYESIDNNGNTSYSAPSVATTITTANSASVCHLTIPTLKLTNKTDARLGVYRTLVNSPLFYRVSSITSPQVNDPTVDTITFVDGFSDATIAANELLYTTGGVLYNVAPGACSIMTTYGDRIFIAGLEDKNQLQYTKQRTLNVPMEFAAELTIQVDPEGGNITALAVLNQYLIIFKEQAIFYIAGSGPDATGLNSDNFGGSPQTISSAIGCINPNAIAIGDFGIMFESDKGIYLLNQSLVPTYIGKEVEAFNSLSITSATVVPPEHVIFTTQEGTALVYNYLVGFWSTFTNHSAVDSDRFAGSPIADVPFIFAGYSGQVYQQNLSKFTDGSLPYKLRLTTGWLPFAGLQGFQRVCKVFLLGEYKSSHQLNLSVAYDWKDSTTGHTTLTPANVLNLTAYGDGYYGENTFGGGPNIYQFRFDLAQQKCSTLKLTIEDSQSSNFGEGYQISGISLEVGAKAGGVKLPATRQFSNS